MLSIFPELLVYQFLGITIIRIIIGLIGVYLAFKILSKRNEIALFFEDKKIPLAFFWSWLLATILFLSSAFVLIGFYIQIACLILSWMILETLILNIWSKGLIQKEANFLYLGLILISFSFLFLGPGILAIDLPF
jgi:uncharacterized membrane protein YphA (DoxX/SURF4 family)